MIPKIISILSPNQYIIPILGVLLIVPLLLITIPMPLPLEVQALWSGNEMYYDTYSVSKGFALILNLIIGIVIVVHLKRRNQWIIRQDLTGYYLGIGIFWGFILISTIFSSYTYLAIVGAPGRFEGVIVWTAYLAICVYAMNYHYEDRTARIIIKTIYVFIAITAAIGTWQLINDWVLHLDFVRNRPFVEDIVYILSIFNIKSYGRPTIYGATYNPNYMGSLSAMMIGVTFVISLFSKGRGRWISGIFLFLSVYLLIGSNSRAGIIGLTAIVFVSLVIFGGKLIRNKKALAKAALILMSMVIVVVGISFAFQYNIARRIGDIQKEVVRILHPTTVDIKSIVPLKDVTVSKDGFQVQINDHIIKYNRFSDEFTDNQNRILLLEEDSIEGAKKTYLVPGGDYDRYRFSKETTAEGRKIIGFSQGKINLYFDVSGESVQSTNKNFMPIVVEDAPYIGFEGLELLGSSRGYIWSRTLPLLKNAVWKGYGADAFLAIFPNDDLYYKIYALKSTDIICDKPHSMYLLIAVNFGIIALGVFVAGMGYYLIRGISYFRKIKIFSSRDIFSLACLLAVVGYLGAGFFNDSALSVAPVFWTLLGLGIATLPERNIKKGGNHE